MAPSTRTSTASLRQRDSDKSPIRIARHIENNRRQALFSRRRDQLNAIRWVRNWFGANSKNDISRGQTRTITSGPDYQHTGHGVIDLETPPHLGG